MTEEQKQLLIVVLRQALSDASDAVSIYTQDKEYETANKFINDIKLLTELLEMQTRQILIKQRGEYEQR